MRALKKFKLPPITSSLSNAGQYVTDPEWAGEISDYRQEQNTSNPMLRTEREEPGRTFQDNNAAHFLQV